MRGVSVLLITIGLMVLLGGSGMDATRTTTTCYEADFNWDAADSSGCVETTYSNPVPKFATIMLGFSLLVGGGMIWNRSDAGTSLFEEILETSNQNERENTNNNRKTTLVEELEANKNDSQEDSGN
jgi:hypothetical protein